MKLAVNKKAESDAIAKAKEEVKKQAMAAAEGGSSSLTVSFTLPSSSSYTSVMRPLEKIGLFICERGCHSSRSESKVYYDIKCFIKE